MSITNITDAKSIKSKAERTKAFMELLNYLDYENEEDKKRVFDGVVSMNDEQWQTTMGLIHKGTIEVGALMDEAEDRIGNFISRQVDAEEALTPEIMVCGLLQYYMNLAIRLNLPEDAGQNLEAFSATSVKAYITEDLKKAVLGDG